ncbi:MAG: peptidase domain-containing ABC transporter [Desulfobacteraceae bacterium]|nr:peptidase domain-containing ABC transporter [Desulfobacteraceae bacterium]
MKYLDQKIDISAVDYLVQIAKHNEIEISKESIFHEYDIREKEIPMMLFLRISNELGLRAKYKKIGLEKLLIIGDVFPVLGIIEDGSSVIIAGIDREDNARNKEKIVIFDKNNNSDNMFLFLDKKEFESRWQNEIILFKKTRSPNTDDEEFSLKWFLPQIAKEKRIFIEIIITALFIHLLTLAVPLYFQNVVDKVLLHHAITTLHVLSFGVIGIIFFGGALQYLRIYLLRFATTKIDLRLAIQTFSHLLKLPLQFFERGFAGVLIKHMQQSDQIREFLTGNLLNTLIDVSGLIIFLPILFMLSAKLSFIVLLFSFSAALIIFLMIKPFYIRLTALYEAEGARQAMLVESIQGMNTVKSLALEPTRIKKWEKSSADTVVTNFKVEKISALGQTIIKTLEKIMSVSIIWVGTFSIFDGTLTIGALIAFKMLSQNVTGPLIRVVELIHEYQKVHLAVNMLGEIMNRKPETGLDKSKLRPEMQGDIKFENVSFSYNPGDQPAVNNTTFAIQKGQVVGIVGQSGSGKTTLTRLLQGLFVLNNGVIRFDDINIRDIDMTHLRKSIGVVLQENFIFYGTVRDNISITRPDATFEEIQKAAIMAGADEFIDALSKGYDTTLEENGSNLSGGQKQRIAIARALITNPRILIFDEATSALDPESESKIQENLNKIALGRTMIIVAHRLSTLKHSNFIVVLDKGEIQSIGTHQELLNDSPIYKNLWEKQTSHMG